MDAKDKVKIGLYSRGGKSWVKQKASDHDFRGEKITPYGLALPKEKETRLYFTESKVTSDFIVDVLTTFWDTHKNVLQESSYFSAESGQWS
jgi:hypothetical protein